MLSESAAIAPTTPTPTMTCCLASGSSTASCSSSSSSSLRPLDAPQQCPMMLLPDGSRLAQPNIRSRLLSRSSSARIDLSHASRPSLYFDAHNADPTTAAPLFTRRVDWLAPQYKHHVLHYVPASLHPQSPHLQLFTKWQKNPRVAAGWNQAWEEDKQREYLEKVQSSEDQLGLIGYWSENEHELGEPWGYVEIYWAKESNLDPFYDFPEQTLGFHALVGEEHFRGPNRVRAWMASVVYMIFTLEPRCDLVVSEPNIKNEKMVNYECECGGRVEKAIDLPHKTAALVFFRKAAFCSVWPLGLRA